MNSTQQQFDLSSFRKEVEGWRDDAQARKDEDARSGFTEHECVAEGEVLLANRVLSRLPGLLKKQPDSVDSGGSMPELLSPTEVRERLGEIAERLTAAASRRSPSPATERVEADAELLRDLSAHPVLALLPAEEETG